jgi:hypothetical protein
MAKDGETRTLIGTIERSTTYYSSAFGELPEFDLRVGGKRYVCRLATQTEGASLPHGVGRGSVLCVVMTGIKEPRPVASETRDVWLVSAVRQPTLFDRLSVWFDTRPLP